MKMTGLATHGAVADRGLDVLDGVFGRCSVRRLFHLLRPKKKRERPG